MGPLVLVLALRGRRRREPRQTESGRIVLTGRSKDLLDDEKVQRAYLG